MGHKNFEVSKNDRNFKKGDILLLKEWDNQSGEYTGRLLSRNVLYVLQGGQFGIEAGYCVLSIG